MTNLEKFNQKTMSSREIATLTGKEHKSVMRDIRTLVENLNKNNGCTSVPVEEIQKDYHRGDRTQYKYLSEKTQDAILSFCFGNKESEYIFSASEYIDLKGEKRPQYELNKKAALLLASGYNVILRAKIIDRWEELEIKEQVQQYELPRTFSEALRQLADTTEEKERAIAEKEIAEQKVTEMLPTVHYAESVLNDKTNTLLTNQIAKEFGMSDQVLNAILRELGVQYKQNGQWLLTQKYVNKGYTDTKTSSGETEDSSWTNVSTVWFQSGRRFIHELIKPLLNDGKLSQIKNSWVLNGKRVEIRKSKTKKTTTLWKY